METLLAHNYSITIEKNVFSIELFHMGNTDGSINGLAISCQIAIYTYTAHFKHTQSC